MDDGRTPEKDSIGLLGDDILSQFDVEFDFPGHKLTFYREVGCYTTFLPWTGVFSTIPFDHHGAEVTIDVLLNSERTRAMIDTGNNLSFVSLSASALWGAATDDLAPTRMRAKSPLNDGAPMPVSAYPFTQVKIGDDLFHDKKLNVIDANLPLASANLGLDYWSSSQDVDLLSPPVAVRRRRSIGGQARLFDRARRRRLAGRDADANRRPELRRPNRRERAVRLRDAARLARHLAARPARSSSGVMHGVSSISAPTAWNISSNSAGIMLNSFMSNTNTPHRWPFSSVK